MQIHYQFQPEKTTQAVAYLLKNLDGETDKVKLIKLMYLADRTSFLRCGAPITGDRQVAMKHGPVPSATLNLINGDDWSVREESYRFFLIENYKIKLGIDPGSGLLEQEEIAILDELLHEHGKKHTWALVDETHDYPEYKDVYVDGTSTAIPYELMLKHYADESGFRKNRAVISKTMTNSIHCPFTASEPDL